MTCASCMPAQEHRIRPLSSWSFVHTIIDMYVPFHENQPFPLPTLQSWVSPHEHLRHRLVDCHPSLDKLAEKQATIVLAFLCAQSVFVLLHNFFFAVLILKRTALVRRQTTGNVNRQIKRLSDILQDLFQVSKNLESPCNWSQEEVDRLLSLGCVCF